MQWGVENDSTTVGGTGGGTVGRTRISALTMTKTMDRSSAILFARSCAGTHIPKALLQVTRHGTDGEEQYFELELQDVIISSYSVSTGASDDQTLTETFSLVFAKILLRYTPGTGEGDIESSWDIEKNGPA
jgi:type VI secretion system secreted protein Hcp